MLITIKNIIGSIRNVLGIVTDGLKMWLPFERSDILGANVVVNGDFAIASGTGLGWTATGGATTTGGVGFLASSPASFLVQNNLVPGKTYYFSIEAKTDLSGNIKISNNGVKFFTNSSLSSSFTTFTGYFTANANDLTIGETGVGGIYIDNVSVKEVTQFAPDTSGNLNNATLYAGKALSFDGVNDYVDFGTDVNNNRTVWTTAIWISNYTRGSYDWIYGDTTQQSIGLNFGAEVDGNIFYRDLYGTYIEFSCDVFKSDFTNAKRLVFTSDGTDIKLYLDGVYIDKVTPSATNLKLSRLMAGYDTSQFMVDATVSDFQLYDTAWTQADVTYDYNKPNHLVTDNPSTSIALSNLKGYWALSEGDGAIAYDSSGEGNDGTINGATYVDQQATIPQLGMMDWAKSTPVSDEITLIANPNNPSQDILGNSVRLREHSLNLDGSGYAEVADDDTLDFGTSDFSYGFWFKVESGSLGFLFGVSSLGNSSGVGLTMDLSNGKIRSRPFGVTSIYTTSGYNDGDWHYAFHNIDRSDSAKLFIDNTEVLSQDISSESSTSLATTDWYVGLENGIGTSLNGLIDDIVIYNKLLSLDERTQNYKAGLNQHKTGSSFSDDFSSDYGF